MNRKSTPTPEPIAQLQRQLDEFRSAHATRTKLPEPLWQAAVELARQHGVHAVAHPLRLDYMGLRRRLDESHNPHSRRLLSHQRKDTPSRYSSNWSHGIRQRLMNSSSSLSLHVTARCASSGRRPRHRIGPVCCGRGGKREDDSDQSDHADPGCDRAGRP